MEVAPIHTPGSDGEMPVPRTVIVGALLVCLRAIYSPLLCQLSVYTLCPLFYWASLLSDLQWLFESKKTGPLSESIPSSAHSNLASIWTTQLKSLFQVTSDLQMGLNPNKPFCPQPRSQQQHPTQLTDPQTLCLPGFSDLLLVSSLATSRSP